MNCERDIRFELLARLCPNSTGADIRSVCTEAGMFAIRARRKTVTEKDFLESVNKVGLQLSQKIGLGRAQQDLTMCSWISARLGCLLQFTERTSVLQSTERMSNGTDFAEQQDDYLCIRCRSSRATKSLAQLPSTWCITSGLI